MYYGDSINNVGFAVAFDISRVWGLHRCEASVGNGKSHHIPFRTAYPSDENSKNLQYSAHLSCLTFLNVHKTEPVDHESQNNVAVRKMRQQGHPKRKDLPLAPLL